jgi:hypothetical protein
LFDIANSLADVMICVPTLNHESHFGIGPRDLIHSLSSLLSQFRGGNPAVISILQDKLTQLGVSVASPQKLIDLSSSEDEREESNGTPRSIGWNDGSMYSPAIATTPYQPFLPPLSDMASMDTDMV